MINATAQKPLARYGTIGEVARFANAAGIAFRRGDRVVLRSHRGIEIGTLLEDAPADTEAFESDTDRCILRTATTDDERTAAQARTECESQFDAWRRRIEQWALQLELIDLERTLDKSKLILYVLNDRGPECTRLALQAAAGGHGTVEVQPVGPEGVKSPSSGGGCGSGGCGSGSSAGGCCH